MATGPLISFENLEPLEAAWQTAQAILSLNIQQQGNVDMPSDILDLTVPNVDEEPFSAVVKDRRYDSILRLDANPHDSDQVLALSRGFHGILLDSVSLDGHWMSHPSSVLPEQHGGPVGRIGDVPDRLLPRAVGLVITRAVQLDPELFN